MKIWSKLSVLATAVMSVACSVTPPADVKVVNNFELTRYLGTWYEIARLDHSFESGLEQVTANYSLRDDGGVKVINRGYNIKKQKWQQSEGKGYFTGPTSRAALKVSFFGPFYGGYHVIALDQQSYRWSLVAGPDRDYLWILARDKTLPAEIREQLVRQARDLGFATDRLIWVGQQRDDTN